MQWDDGDEYEVVGNGTKDLIVRLGFGFCSADEAGSGSAALCKETDRDVDALTVPLNTDLGAAGDLVTLDTEGDLKLNYAATRPARHRHPAQARPDAGHRRARHDEGRGRGAARGDDIGLSASIGPVGVEAGNGCRGHRRRSGRLSDPGVGVVKLGAELERREDRASRTTTTTRSTTTARSRSATSSATWTSTSRARTRISSARTRRIPTRRATPARSSPSRSPASRSRTRSS